MRDELAAYIDAVPVIDFFKEYHPDAGRTFDDYLGYVEGFLARTLGGGMIAGKFGTPYWHSLDFPYDEDNPRRVYDRLILS